MIGYGSREQGERLYPVNGARIQVAYHFRLDDLLGPGQGRRGQRLDPNRLMVDVVVAEERSTPVLHRIP